MSKLFMVVLALLFSINLNAQFQTIATSPKFDEPQNGFVKLLFLKNGNTAYVHLSDRDGITVKMYDTQHKQLFSKNVSGNTEFKGLEAKNIFELQGNLMIVYSNFEGSTNKLNSLLVNGNDGLVIGKQFIADLAKLNLSKGYSMAFGSVEKPDFYVRPNTDNTGFGVAVFNSFAKETEERVEFIQYNASAKEVMRRFIGTPNDKFKYINIIDFTYSDANNAQLLIYAFNTQKGSEGTSYIVTAPATNKQVVYTALYNDNGNKSTDGILRYDAKNNRVLAVIQAVSGVKKDGIFTNTGKTTYSILMYAYQPGSRAVVELSLSGMEELDRVYEAVYPKGTGFSGILQNFYTNPDGTYTLVMEGLTTTSSSYRTSSSVSYSIFDAVAITFQNDKVVDAVLSPYSHAINTSMMSGGLGETYGPLNNYQRNAGGAKLKGGNQYKSFSYFRSPSKSYLLVNDIAENEEKLAKNKNITTIQGIGECDAFYYRSKATDPAKRHYVFGDPINKEDHYLGIFTASDYNLATNEYATIRLLRNDKEKKVNIVWMQPK